MKHPVCTSLSGYVGASSWRPRRQRRLIPCRDRRTSESTEWLSTFRIRTDPPVPPSSLSPQSSWRLLEPWEIKSNEVCPKCQKVQLQLFAMIIYVFQSYAAGANLKALMSRYTLCVEKYSVYLNTSTWIIRKCHFCSIFVMLTLHCHG
jgi:hypothetical protein